MIPIRPQGLFLAVMALALILGLAPVRPAVAQDAPIPWDDARRFQRSSFQEDIRVVLRSIVGQQGLQLNIRPDVSGEITAEFDTSLRGAFTRLIEENDLDFAYDPATGTVTVSPATDEVTRQFRTLQNVTARELRSVKQRFGLGGRLVIDEVSGTVLVEGPRDDVQTLIQLLQRLEDTAAARAADALARRQADLIASDAFAAQEIRVIPLKYTSVGPTTQLFNNRSVTVPGIDQTLRTLLGDAEDIGNGPTVEALPLPDGATPLPAPLSFDGGVPRISIDPRTNSVVLRGTPVAIARVEQLIRELDRPVPMIEIEVLIVGASDGVSEEIGLDFAAQYQTTARSFGINSGLTGSDVTAGDALGLVGDFDPILSSVLGGFVYNAGGFQFRAELQALEAENRTQTIAAPRVVTLNGVPARIASSSSSFFSIVQGDTAGLEEVQTGVILEITPVVIENDVPAGPRLIRLNLSAQNTAPDVTTAGASSLTVSGSEVVTDLIIPEGATFVLGGLFDDSRVEADDGIPLLKDIPILGALFGTETRSNEFNETLFFLTPRVVDPSTILPQTDPTRRYIEHRRSRLADTRLFLQGTARDAGSPLRFLEEDE